MISKIQKKFPYRGITNWVAVCAVLFIVSQLLWYCSRVFRKYDLLEIPMVIFFFPLAPFFDPHNGMVNSKVMFFYALPYWLLLFVVSLAASRKRMNPLVPAILLLIASAIASMVYALFFVEEILMP